MFEKFSEFTSIVTNDNGDDTTFITLTQNLQGDIEVARIVCAFVKGCFDDMSWATCEVTSYVPITQPVCLLIQQCMLLLCIDIFVLC